MEQFEVAVVGAGHAGIEAALASSRMGRKTVCITLDLARIGHLPCNCSIGGPAKGHIAREVDALGGQMGLTTDLALTHIRRVGTGKGPAVQTVRAHVCKTLYPQLMRSTLENQENLTLIEGSVERIGGGERVQSLSVRIRGSEEVLTLCTQTVVVTTGTFLNGLCHEGDRKTVAARHGDPASISLAQFLVELGIRVRRFKTGTTPRITLSSIDLSVTEVLDSEPQAGAISFMNEAPKPLFELLPAWQTKTNLRTHQVLRDNLDRSAMYGGQIEGIGPRYCPSVEDKVVRFSEKESHPIFLEKEDWGGESVYVQGFSTSMPAEVQLAALRTIDGLANAEMLRPGYAVEYDMADPLQLDSTLMSKLLPGLFFAGQINGTSGYEEAAGQGIVAGINAALYARDSEPIIFARDNSFIGVMIDDLVTKGVEDPYRMLTARAEHRLLLRHDNADFRLTPIARELGLCSNDRWRRFQEKSESVHFGLAALRSTYVLQENNDVLIEHDTSPVKNRISLFDLLRRPENSLETIESIANATNIEFANESDMHVREQLELAAAYDGYIQIQKRVAAQARLLEDLRVPPELDYDGLRGLSFESIEKLSRVRPKTVGQASRVPGVRPSDIALLIGHLRSK